jgi:hypothetical protein
VHRKSDRLRDDPCASALRQHVVSWSSYGPSSARIVPNHSAFRKRNRSTRPKFFSPGQIARRLDEVVVRFRPNGLKTKGR